MRVSYDCDVLVVGAGINGVGVAQACAAAGYSVRVLEQRSIAAGTSSRSSKLIHGGLRYLERGNLRLVRESLHERELLLRLAAPLVRRIAFHIPIYHTTSRSPLTIRLGLSLYALLAGLGREVRFSQLPRRQWQELDGLATDNLRAVFRYADAQTDDAALTRAVMRSAAQFGAQLDCPAQFLRAESDADGVAVYARVNDKDVVLRARTLVNAAGPWVGDVQHRLVPPFPAPVATLVEGTHIVVPGVLTQGAYYVEAPHDRRAVFVLPWHDGILLGTTEREYIGDPSAVQPRGDEINYLRATAQHYFPKMRSETQRAFAGLRVLPSVDTDLFRRSREAVLAMDDAKHARIVSVYGGKLTTYRVTAQRVLARLRGALPTRRAHADTAELFLSAD